VEDFSVIKTKDVYLPKGSDWYDFWTGEKFTGGQIQKKETPLEIIPLYVKAGSVLPIGPKVQYATEKKWDNLEIRIYEGANGEFTLYEDENDNYNYEKGIYSTITFNWDDAKKTLTISECKGSFPGMLAERKFNIVLVGKNKGIGDGTTDKFDKVVSYSGKRMVVKL
jgi:alpha-D-xyloside xylohydrolase